MAPRDDAPHRGDRRVRGLPLQHDGQHRRLAVDVRPDELWARERERLLLLGAILAGSVLLVALQSTIKQQVIFAQLPMLLRWQFHRLMLGQSMAFYQDEFAGRIATKVMQTALAVREVWLIVAEMLVFVTIYFVTLLSVLGGFDGWLVAPSSPGWRCTRPRCPSSSPGSGASPRSRPTPAR